MRTLRREKGLSQEELAAMVGASRQALSKWEAGQSRPELDKLLALSDIFSVTMDSLVRPGGPEPQPDPPASPSLGWWYHGPVIEYKSARTLRGLPLVHINLGPGKRRARGVLAIGNVATGLVSVGFVARGGLSLGILSLGVLSIGPLAVGLLAVGALALGVASVGAVAIGLFAVGGCAVASHVAIGDVARGHVAVGRDVRGAFTLADPAFSSRRTLTAEQVHRLIRSAYPQLWDWLVGLLTAMFP
ncbi:helix-turn-helix domain-containing protein [Anaeromassilibacillus sp. SJQ-5]